MTEIAKLRELWEASTPGDWEVYSEPDVGMPPTLMAMVPYGDRVLKFLRRPIEPLSDEDMAFIAAAHNQMGRLLDVVEAAEAVRRLVRDEGYHCNCPVADLFDALDEMRSPTPEPKAIYEGTGEDL